MSRRYGISEISNKIYDVWILSDAIECVDEKWIIGIKLILRDFVKIISRKNWAQFSENFLYEIDISIEMSKLYTNVFHVLLRRKLLFAAVILEFALPRKGIMTFCVMEALNRNFIRIRLEIRGL